MTTIGVELEGMAQLLAQLKALGADADDVVREVVTDLVMDTQAIAIAGIQRSYGKQNTKEK